MNPLILETVARVVSPLLYVFAAWLFLKGHNSPGGGFIAGLLTAAAIVLTFVARGRETDTWREEAFVTVIGVGLLVAAIVACAPMLLGLPFFTHEFTHVHLPLLGDIELATAALFDLGVYIVVVGNVVTVIRAMTDRES